MSKKAILFTTRFLEKNGYLFNSDSLTACDHAFEKNKVYCDFFLGNENRDELKSYLCDEYYKDTICSFLKIPNIPENSLDDLLNQVSENFPEYDEFLDKTDGSRCLKVYKEGVEHKTFLFPRKIECKNNKLHFGEEEVSKNELVKYIKSCHNEAINKLRINIDCPYDYNTLLAMRFKLYKLKIEADNVVAYAVWPLRKTCDSSLKTKWYEALCTEIVNDNKDKEGNIEINEIDLFLHDVDIRPSTTYTVWEKDAKYDFLDKSISLNIALFQHSNDPVAALLSTTDNVGGTVKKAIDLIHEAKYGSITFELLSDLDDILAMWHVRPHDTLTSEFKQIIISLQKAWDEREWETDFPYLKKVYEDKLEIGQNLKELNLELDNAIRKISSL